MARNNSPVQRVEPVQIGRAHRGIADACNGEERRESVRRVCLRCKTEGCEGRTEPRRRTFDRSQCRRDGEFALRAGELP
jgi:hypothetical protein